MCIVGGGGHGPSYLHLDVDTNIPGQLLELERLIQQHLGGAHLHQRGGGEGGQGGRGRRGQAGGMVRVPALGANGIGLALRSWVRNLGILHLSRDVLIPNHL